MQSNLEKYKKELERLIKNGMELLKDLTNQIKKRKVAEEEPPHAEIFFAGYQPWYTEACEIIRQLLPYRLKEFESLYYSDPKRKKMDVDTYSIQDWMIGKRSGLNGFMKKYFDDFGVTIMKYQTQFEILKASELRLKSCLFEIKQLVQADLFDSELDTCQELLKNGFLRAAGVVSGVVLEKHLTQVCHNHNVSISKKDPCINDLNEYLKSANIIDIPAWRFNQHLGDLRNLCSHNKGREPKREEVEELIGGVKKISKTIF